MKPFTDVHAAMNFVDTFRGSSRELRLPISDSMNDVVGVHMVMITDRILAREWEPDGYDQITRNG
jgi:hypothetical protein